MPTPALLLAFALLVPQQPQSSTGGARDSSMAGMDMSGMAMPGDSAITARLAHDQARREVTIRIGPFVIPNTGKGHNHSMAASETEVYRVTWPARGWFNSFDVELEDSAGNRMSRKFLHHVSMVNLNRRQLVYPAFERILGASQEVDNFSAPKSIGVPLEPGMVLGTFVGWHNATGHEISGATLVIRMRYMPPNMMPRPLDIHLLYMDVAYVVGKSDAYTLPAGYSSTYQEFTVPVGGRLLAVGGHLHDYAKFVRLEDAETGKVLIDLTARTDSTGRLKRVDRKYLAITGPGLRLKANHRYRVRADYDNPNAAVKNGAMGLMVGAFVPDDPSRWPTLDLADEGILADIAMLERQGRWTRKPKAATDSTATSMPMHGGDSGHEHHSQP